MPLTGLTGEAASRFADLLKAGVSYRTALALADRVTDADLSAFTPSGGGGGTAGVTSINGKTGVIALLAPADVGLGNVNNTSDAAKPLSTAATNALAAKADLVGGLIPTAQLPAVSLVKPTPVTTQAAMLALTAAQVQPGDVVVVANDPGRGSYMLNAADPSVLANWILLTSPTDAVTSVNGHTGPVVLAAADVNADPAGAAATAQANATAASDPAGAATTAQANAIAASAPKYLVNTYGAAMTGNGSLDPVKGIYRPPGAKLANLRARIAAAMAGTGIADLVFIGPSTTMGAVTGVVQSPPTALVKALQAMGVPAQQGWANTAYSTAAPSVSSNDPRWTYPDGSWTVFQTTTPYIAGAFTGTSGRRAVFTSTEKGTIVEFMVVGASGPYTYSIDGGTAVAVAAQALNTYTTPVVVTGLPYGVHTLTITPTSTALVYLAKARVRNATGVIVNNAGWSGAAMEDWDKTDSTMAAYPGSAFALPFLAGLGLQGPPIYVIDCAAVINSYINSSGHTAGYTTAMATATLGRVIDQCRVAGGDVILLNPAAPSTTVQFGTNPLTPISDAVFESYRQVMYAVADSKNCFLIDDVERTGLWAQANTNGLEFSDGFHKSAQGYAEIADAIADFLSLTPPTPTFLSIAPVQRGVWAPNTAYGLNDLVIDPSGNLVTPIVPFVSAAAYSAANWTIVVPATNVGRELTGAESGADFNIVGTSGWQDVPGMTGTIPAGIPFTCEISALCAAVQGTAAIDTITGIQLRVVDAATATTVYGFAWRQLGFTAASGQTMWQSVHGLRRGAGLGAATAVKMQAQVGAVAGQGNIGLFPASGGGGEPTTFLVRGR